MNSTGIGNLLRLGEFFFQLPIGMKTRQKRGICSAPRHLQRPDWMTYCGPLVERRLELFPHMTRLRIQKLEVGALAGAVVEDPMTREGQVPESDELPEVVHATLVV